MILRGWTGPALVGAALLGAAEGAAAGEDPSATIPFRRAVANVEYAAVELARDPPASVRTPAPAGDIYYGEIMRRLPGEGFDVSGHYVPFAAEYEKERAVRAWCDADLDGDLWEGAPLALNEYPALPGARSFLIDLRWTASADGREVPVDWKVRVVLEAARPGSRAPVYRTQMVFAMMGEVPVAGRPHRAFLFDGDGDGLYTQGHADGLFIDLDDDRSFVVDVMSPEFGPLGAPFQMEGRRLQVVAVDLEGREVSLRESGGGPPGAGIAAAAAAPAPKAGDAAPDFAFRDAAGREVRLSDLRGRWVALHFWSSRCGACGQQVDTLRLLHDRYHGSGFEVVGISFDTDRGEMEAFRKLHAQPWPTSFTGLMPWEDPVGRLYRERAPGAVHLVDRDGKVEGVYRDATALARRVAAAFAAPAAGP